MLGALVRRFGRFDVAEDAVQEALLAASRQWPADGVPDNPRSWLIRSATGGWSTCSAPTRPGAGASRSRRRPNWRCGNRTAGRRRAGDRRQASPCCCCAATRR